ncbi:hypothetical protein KKE78_03660 [Patescibacteria group bacterium]|nr:hypothetical protein [Patescibacteria group bacterium]
MRRFVPTRLRVEKNIVTRVVRTLEGKGALTARVGQQVAPDEIIGSGTVAPGFRILNLSTLLSVSPGEVEKYLTRKLNQKIYRGELLALKKSWLSFGKKVVTSPTDGVLDFLNTKTGELKIAFLPKKTNLPAGVYGIVEDVDTERGRVIIRTLVSRIYGMFGSGRVRDGALHILGKKDSLVSKEEIQAKYYRQILVGGSLFFKDTISACISTGVNGIIVGGSNSEDYKGMAGGRLVFPRKLDNDIGIGVVICEGFGSIPIGDDIFEVLSEYEGKFVFIDGNKAMINLPSFSSVSLTTIKNTKLPPLINQKLTQFAGHLAETQELKIGSKVRIVGNSCLGEQGKVVSIDDSLSLLPSGAKDYLVTIETRRRKFQMPIANLEMIG